MKLSPEDIVLLRRIDRTIELLNRLIAEASQCEMRWVAGMFTPSDRPTGRCVAPHGHTGPHKIPGLEPGTFHDGAPPEHRAEIEQHQCRYAIMDDVFCELLDGHAGIHKGSSRRTEHDEHDDYDRATGDLGRDIK